MVPKTLRFSLRRLRGGRHANRVPVSGKISMPNFVIPNVAIDPKALRLATKGSERLPLMDQRAVKAADEALKVVDGVLEERKDEAKSFKR